MLKLVLGLSNWLLVAVTVIICMSITTVSEACSRIVYLGEKDSVIVGRSMDWSEDPGTNLYVFPRGMKRDGAAGKSSLEWKSKYGSVICGFYDVATVDGMNEAGLVVNVLYLTESNYGTATSKQKTISISVWDQYVLDNFATVAEAVDALSKEPFVIIAPTLPNGSLAQGHMAISDPSGDSAIFEYVDGKLVIHHDRKYQVMTNSPTFDQQLSLSKYWEQIGGATFLPGTHNSADRFVRASYYINAVAKTNDDKKAVAAVFSVIRGVSVPLGITTPGKPNIASTIWRTVYDQKAKVMYFDSAASPTVFWVNIADLDFRPGADVKKLQLTQGETYSGNVAAAFDKSKPFTFLSASTSK